MAEMMDVNTMGILGIIDLAIGKGSLLDKKKLVDQLMGSGFRISEKLYKRMFPDSG